jgi:hypothetical protein
MLPASNAPRDSAEISARIHDAPKGTTIIFRETMEATCRRFPSLGQSVKTARIECLLDADALAEAELALIDLELPQWQVRRMAYDGGEWYCALSRDRELPDWLDQSVQAHHQDLTLAILAAFVEAQAVTTPLSQTSVPTVRHETSTTYVAASCDNFI